MLRIRLFLLSLKDSTDVTIAGMGRDLRPLRQNESSEQGGFDCRLGHSVSRGQKPVISNLPSINADSLTKAGSLLRRILCIQTRIPHSDQAIFIL